ncbi:MAG TPA: sigma-70 family RNA polymerase sigma factor [Polyangiaceae bacterium]
MSESDFPPVPSRAELAEPARARSARDGRLRELVDEHYDFVWRTLRYLGVPDANAEDGAQKVVCVLARRLDEVEKGAERAFLFSTALRVAATMRRSDRRRPRASSDDDVEALAHSMPSTEELLDERRAHETLRRVLDEMPLELRVVFVLFELEELTSPDIATMLGIPVGTVASRLRRARETFQAIVRRMKAGARPRRDEP